MTDERMSQMPRTRHLNGKSVPACHHDSQEGKPRNDAGGLVTAVTSSPPPMNYAVGQFREVINAATGPIVVPLGCELPLPLHSPADLYRTLTGSIAPDDRFRDAIQPQGYLLESLEGNPRSARYTFIGADLLLVIRLSDPPAAEGDERFCRLIRPVLTGDPVNAVRSLLSVLPMAAADGPRLMCGFVGYFCYEFVQATNPRLATVIPGPHGTLLGELVLPRISLAIDHLTHRMHVYSPVLVLPGDDPGACYDEAVRYIRSACRSIQAGDPAAGGEGSSPTPGSLPACNRGLYQQRPEKDIFCDGVTKLREHILAGDIFQAVISTRIEGTVEGNALALYDRLRLANPSPYHYFLDFGGQCICGASPEMLVRVDGRQVTTVPIAGTRPRGCTPDEDAALGRELLADPKERAEHTMLVDLARNDLGRVCSYGSVKVDGFMTLEAYSHVQHLVTTVTGELAPGREPFDAFISCFPAGTVTGAPKIRAMEIIGDVEGEPRGVYAGAVGYLALNGPLEFAIAIRTAVIRNGRFSVQAGAGIVADSVPSREWDEASQKAGALLAALGCRGDRP